MKLTIEPTETILQVEGAPVRRWVGEDEQGVPVEVMVRCLSPETQDEDVAARFRERLEELPRAKYQPVIFDLRFILD